MMDWTPKINNKHVWPKVVVVVTVVVVVWRDGGVLFWDYGPTAGRSLQLALH